LPWTAELIDSGFGEFLPVATFEAKEQEADTGVIFRLYSRGAETTRDSWLYNFSTSEINSNTQRLIETT